MEAETNLWGLVDIYIPAEVLFHPRLTLTEKMLFGFIRNLSRSERGCWASNKWLGGCLGIKAQTVSIAVSNLRRCGFVYIERHGRKGRRIFINISNISL